MNKTLFVITGPSGAGEDSVIQGLQKILPIERVITTSTRAMRARESQGHPYYFISKKEFQDGLEENRFFEHAEQDLGNLYGVTHEEIQRVQQSGKMGIWKLDFQGAKNAKILVPSVVVIFISASLPIIEQRIRARGSMSEEQIQKRIEYAKGWWTIRDVYDYEVENVQGKLPETIAQVAEVIRQEAGLLPEI